MPAERDENTGKYTRKFPVEDFVMAVEDLGTATTSNVAEIVGCSYDLAYRRLKDLEAEEEVTARRVGDSFLWSRCE